KRDVERGERKHGRTAASTIMQTPPDVMPDALCVIGFAAFDQLRDLAPEDVGDRATVPADSVGVACAFGTIGIVDATNHEFESRDFAMRAVGESDLERNAVKPGLDCPDTCHCAFTWPFACRLERRPPRDNHQRCDWQIGSLDGLRARRRWPPT